MRMSALEAGTRRPSSLFILPADAVGDGLLYLRVIHFWEYLHNSDRREDSPRRVCGFTEPRERE
jgi:hypothetical protein